MIRIVTGKIYVSHLKSFGCPLALEGQELLRLEVLHVHVALKVSHLFLQVVHVAVLACAVHDHVDVVTSVRHLWVAGAESMLRGNRRER